MCGGNGYKGQNEILLHFGLDSAESVDEVIVRWPDGFSRRLRNLDVNRRYMIGRTDHEHVPPPGNVLNF